MDKIEKFNTLASEALAFNKMAKTSRAGNKNKQAELSFHVLTILMKGLIQEVEHITKAFGTEGAYHDIRMVLSRCKTVAVYLAEKGNVPLKTKDVVVEYTKEQIMSFVPSEETPFLFNISTAYNTINADKTPKALTTEEQYLNAYFEATGWKEEDFNDHVKIQPSFKDEALGKGKVFLEEQKKAAILAHIPALKESIQKQFLALAEIAPNEVESFLNNLSGLLDIAKPEPISAKSNKKAA